MKKKRVYNITKNFVPSKTPTRELVFYVRDTEKNENVKRSYYIDECLKERRRLNKKHDTDRYTVKSGYVLIKDRS